jgi:hypothetical protein
MIRMYETTKAEKMSEPTKNGKMDETTKARLRTKLLGLRITVGVIDQVIDREEIDELTVLTFVQAKLGDIIHEIVAAGDEERKRLLA